MSKETEDALKERIKELTCLYEISSIIESVDIESIENVLKACVFSLKKAFLFPDFTDIKFSSEELEISTNRLSVDNPKIESSIRIFNEPKGKIIASLNGPKLTQDDFLKEEQQLLDNVALKVGNLLERIEIQKSETSLKRQMEHADRLSILGEITAGIAHELNTPLANILGFAELLKSDLEGDKKIASDLNKIIDNAIFSREVLKKLLFFSCKMPQEKKQVNLVPIIKSAINLLDATFRKEKVKYSTKINEEELWLKADPIQLTQIIFNLLINAIYFSPKEGLVTIQALQKKDSIILKISDEGKGLTPNDLEKIFQPFFTTKPMEDGSGLGLSVVHGIVASHKGSIIAENNPDKGAVFTVTLPKN
ncbi:MAG: HAMP domain-containing sensor histidine kinase [Algibacter sp.]|uniref:sensor histidine kinase n=1 Tax=Algibacter sp. TaxID=1872428 RepID=UPI003299D642